MQKSSKILSLILTLCMCMGIMVPMAFAEGFSDVPATHSYYTAISNLAVDGIINGFEDGTYRPEEGVTRAQFAKIICYALNVGDVVGSAKVDTGFTDVPSEHWAAGNIKVAANMGIINGMGDGTFLPENPVLYEQAIKMIVCALGYGAQADAKGGYYNGHLSVATDLGILKGINDGYIGKGANRGTIAKLVDNMLNAKTITSEGKKGDSIRDTVLKSSSVNGKVTAIYGSSIYSGETSPCGRNQIRIEGSGKTYIISVEDLSIDPADFLGKTVAAYYKEDEDLKFQSLSQLSVLENKNTIVTVDMADITDFKDTLIEYVDENGDDQDVSVDIDANILYNGVATSAKLSSFIDPTLSGELTLIDSGNSGSANVVFVKTYDTIIVKSKSADAYKLYDENNTSKTLVLDETDKSKTISIKKNGSASTFKNISVGDVVSYASSTGGEVIDVRVSNKVISGTVSRLNASQNKATLKSSSTESEHKYSKYFIVNYIDTAKVSMEVSTSGKFYIDAFGKIAKADTAADSTVTYGYVTGFEDVGSSTSPKLAIKIININGSSSSKATLYYFADKFKLDGVNYNMANDADTVSDKLIASSTAFNTTSFVTTDAAKTKYTQAIKYTTNSSGKIDKVYTVNYTADENNKLKVDNTYYSVGELSVPKIKCTTGSSRLESKYVINSKTKVLFVPKERFENGSAKFIGYTNSYFKSGSSYNVQLIDTDTSFNIPIILVYGSAADASATVWATRAPVVVKEISSEFVDGETKACITVITSAGKEESYYEGEDGASFDTLSIGDIIRLDVNSSKEVEEIKNVLKHSDFVAGSVTPGANAEGDNKSTTYAQYRTVIGTANILGESTLNIVKAFVDSSDVLDLSAGEETITVNDSTKVIIIDSAKIDANDNKAITLESIGEVIGYDDQPENASKILIYTASSVTAKAIFVLR